MLYKLCSIRLFCIGFILAIFLSSLSLYSEETAISINYELLDNDAFHRTIVGNTVVGVTRQSKSVYMLYFAPEGICQLWKQSQIFEGSWWIDKDEKGRSVVHAFWPTYRSTQPKSLFSTENPRYGTPTSVLYYHSPQNKNALLLVTKSAQAAATVVPGKQFGENSHKKID